MWVVGAALDGADVLVGGVDARTGCELAGFRDGERSAGVLPTGTLEQPVSARASNAATARPRRRADDFAIGDPAQINTPS